MTVNWKGFHLLSECHIVREKLSEFHKLQLLNLLYKLRGHWSKAAGQQEMAGLCGKGWVGGFKACALGRVDATSGETSVVMLGMHVEGSSWTASSAD